MMKIKIIDLLNKSANGESLPLKIKYGGYEFQYDIINNCYVDKNDLMLEDHVNFFNKINDEVEIIEEDKNIEKLNDKARYYFSTVANGMTKRDREALDEMFEKCYKTIDELIDEVNKLIEKEKQ